MREGCGRDKHEPEVEIALVKRQQCMHEFAPGLIAEDTRRQKP
jgi:hypothetical protein